jgi:hypothetical protein
MSYPWSGTITAAIARLASYYNGSDYNASTNPGGFGHGGHTTNFIPALQDDATVANAIADAADYANTAAVAAAASAVTAAAAATALIATSTTSVAIGVGSKSFTTQADKSFSAGTPLVIFSAANPSLNYMGGIASAYSGTSLTVNVTGIGGSGTFTDWTIAVAGLPGAAGAGGITGPIGPTAGLELAFGNGTTDSDPGNGIFKMSSGTFASITTLYFDNLDRFGNDIAAILDTFDDPGKSTDRGRLSIVQISAPQKRMLFTVTGSVVDGTGYRKISVTPIGVGTIPTNAENCTILFAEAGAPGSDGIGSGTVIGDTTSTAGHIPIYSDATGNHISDGAVGIGTSGANVPQLNAANTWSSGQLQTFAGGLKGNWTPGAESTVASATTCDIGAAATNNILISGTTTITGFGTTADQVRFVRFSGALTLTHNASSLILPGGANIITVAGDTCLAVSDDSGNWRVFNYVSKNQSIIGPAEVTVASATTTEIGLVGTSFVAISGTTTITGFGTAASRLRFIRFTGILTLTHNSSSLILPGAANITTAAGDTCVAISDASGNWRVYNYTKASGKATIGPASTDITDATTVGKAVLTTASAAAARSTLGGVGVVAQQIFTSGGTYTPRTGLIYAVIECVGGGGGGGGVAGASGFVTGGGGGGGGSYARTIAIAATIGASQTITIGAGAAAGTTGGGTGSTGGSTSCGSICVAAGGVGGTGGGSAAIGSGGAGGAPGTSDFGAAGMSGNNAPYSSSAATAQYQVGTTQGGNSGLGMGAGGKSTYSGGASITGTAGSNYGGGGSGAMSVNVAANAAGGAGAGGVCIITEYATQ